MPVPQPQRPVLATQEHQKDYDVTKHIPFSLIRYPTYEYETGTQMFLSKRQRIVVDAYLKTENVTEATRVLNEIAGRHGRIQEWGVDTVRRWLQKPHVARHIAQKWIDQGKANWLDKDKWKAWGADALAGKSKPTMVQASIWREFGKSQGWYEGAGPATVNNTQYNFLQSNGKS